MRLEGGVEQVGCGRSLKGVYGGVEIAHFYLAFIGSVDAGKDCGCRGLQLWDFLKTVCVCVHNVVLGVALGKGLRVCVCVCAYLCICAHIFCLLIIHGEC